MSKRSNACMNRSLCDSDYLKKQEAEDRFLFPHDRLFKVGAHKTKSTIRSSKKIFFNRSSKNRAHIKTGKNSYSTVFFRSLLLQKLSLKKISTKFLYITKNSHILSLM